MTPFLECNSLSDMSTRLVAVNVGEQNEKQKNMPLEWMTRVCIDLFNNS